MRRIGPGWECAKWLSSETDATAPSTGSQRSASFVQRWAARSSRRSAFLQYTRARTARLWSLRAPHIEIRCLAIQQWIREERSICESSGHEEHCRSLHETPGWIAKGSWAFQSWMVRTVQTGMTELRDFEQRFQSSRGVSILSFNC